MAKKTFNEKIKKFEKIQQRVNFVADTISWGARCMLSGLKMFVTIILFLPGFVMFFSGFWAFIFGLIATPIARLFAKIKLKNIARAYPDEYEKYTSEQNQLKQEVAIWRKETKNPKIN